MLVQEMEHFSASKARGVARTASIEIETSAASAVQNACCSIVARVYHSFYLRLLQVVDKFVKCVVKKQIASSEGRRKIPWTTTRTT